MERNKRNAKIKELKRDGFKVVTGLPSIYINAQGKVFNLKKGRFMKPSRQIYIKPETKLLNVAKLVLQMFDNQQYKSGYIKFIDGDKSNLSLENLKYLSLFPPNHEPEPLNTANVLNAIRCYFKIEERFNINDSFRFKYYMRLIADSRGFFSCKRDTEHIEVFKGYLNGNAEPLKNDMSENWSISETAKHYDITIRDCTIIVSHFKNVLVNEILQDLEKGVLAISEFQAKTPSTTETLKKLNKRIIEKGEPPIKLQNKSDKEKAVDFINRLNEHKNQSTK